MAKYISVPNKTKVELRERFHTTKETVWAALNFKTDSDLARRIRSTAIIKGGTVCDPDKQNFINLKK